MIAELGIVIFGGTFDPVHLGHLRSALEVKDALGAEKVKLIPSYNPPHRDDPGGAAVDRLQMLRLAVQGVPCFEVDDREITREGKSYTIDTLKSLRDEMSPDTPLYLTLGFDAFLLLDQWHDWQRLLDYAHLVVLARPGSATGNPSEELAAYLHGRQVDNPLCLRSKPGGMICNLALTRMDISASKVRELFRTGRSADYLVPEKVIRYIQKRELYRTASS